MYPRGFLVFIAFVLGSLVSLASAQEMGRWLKRSPLPVPRSEVAVAEVSGKIYVIGGFDGDRRTSEVVEAYDPATDQWTQIAPLPRGLNHPMAAGANGKLYVIGGYLGPALSNATNALWEYDPTTQRWTERAAMPTVRAAGAAVAIDGKIYVVGGARAAGSVGDFAAYDPQTNRWTTLPPMPTPRDHIAAGAYGKKLYVAGGRPPFTGGLRTLEVFDLETQRWAALTPMPTGRSGIAGAIVKGCFYVFGGEGNRQSATGVYEQNEVYDPKSNRWESQPPMPTPRHGIGAAVWENKIYIPGGAPLLGFSISSAHEVYEPTKSCE